MIAAVSISEPMTFATDLLVAVVAVLCARALWRRNSDQPSTARGYWLVALLALALAALAGGLAHALATSLPGWLESGFWATVFFAMGLASFAMVVGAAYATTLAPLRYLLLLAAGVGFVIYALRARNAVDFRLAILGYTVALAVVGGLAAVSLLRNRQVVTMRWWLLSIGVTALASVVQQSGLTLHRHFNHNDLYHVLGALAVIGFFLGARRVEDGDRIATGAQPAVEVEVEASESASVSIGDLDSSSPPDLEVDNHTSA